MVISKFHLRHGLVGAGLYCSSVLAVSAQVHPNIILIMADDQGYGDLGITGNPHIKTPVLDRFGKESIRFTNFFVCPVSAPTRSSLMTGRYSMRTGIRDTYNGGAIMAASEVTIAEMLRDAGYRTGIFGKWHLGDNYPSRPCDQGFDESVIHLSGGMAQPGDFTTYLRGDSSYFDPVLWHNGKQQRYQGYCTDIFTERAIDFIEKNRDRPFFCYIAFNAPHTPLQVPDSYYQMYRNIDPSSGFSADPRPFQTMNEKDKEDARRVYAMVSNIDDNMRKLLKKIDELGISENTAVIYLTDNGPQQRRYLAGMRGLKGSVYNGGVRVPFFFRYPALKISNKDVDVTSAHIDVLPTIAQLCGATVPQDRKIDGRSLLPYIIKGERPADDERPLFFYWTRHNPEKYINIALMKGRYKLVGQTGYDADIDDFQMFDLIYDPYEQVNIVGNYHSTATLMKKELDSMLTELASSANMVDPPRIETGTASENPVFLDRNDAGGERGIWEQEEIYGLWNLSVHEGFYNIRFRFIKPVPAGGSLVIELNSVTYRLSNSKDNQLMLEMKDVFLPDIRCQFVPWYETAGKRILPLWLEIEKVPGPASGQNH
jgi:arylsulfatase A-like enzyme